MREVLGEASFEATNTVYNRTMVASELTLENLVKNIIPLTGWYRQIIQPIDTERTTRSAKKRSKRKSSRIGPRLPKLNEVWEDIVRDQDPNYRFRELLSFVRIAGLIAYLKKRGPQEEAAVAEKLAELAKENDHRREAIRNEIGRKEVERREAIRNEIGEKVLEGWKSGLRETNLPGPMGQRRE